MSGDGEEDGIRLDTRESPGEAGECKAEWEAVVARAGLDGTYEVVTGQVRLPASRRRAARFAFGVFLRLRPGVTADAAAGAAMQFAVRAGVTVTG